MHRRQWLQASMGGLFGGLAFPGWVQGTRPAEPAARTGFARAKSRIVIYLLGGPPHQAMWDLKPLAPAEIRGPFRPIATRVPGIHISEHLPRLAGQADKLAIVRSVTYPNHDHPFMIYYTLTGRMSPVPLGENTVLPPSRNDYPHLGSVVARFRHRNPAVPGYVAIFLGPSYDPFAVNDDPCQPLAVVQPPADVSPHRLQTREALLAVLEGCGPRSRATAEHAAFRRSASRLVQAAGTRDLFALDREPGSLRDRYGRHRFGQSLLLDRRLVEAGVSLVAIHFNFMSRCDGWDTHSKNFECLQGEPLLDQGMSALLDDLDQRGLLDETLVVCLGEFGRTPRINANAGRDHWGHCAAVVLAGGGIRSGQLHGSSDR